MSAAMKRGSSGLSLVVAVNKSSGMTSHDVVNRCRSIFVERRVGHTGTLDPLATGVLPICIGPATRLDRYLTGHDKRYRVAMRFGFETTTDDVSGEPTVSGSICADLADGAFAEGYIAGLVGLHEQVPPRYSAVKQGGKKAYELARKGEAVELAPREIEVYESSLVSRSADNGEIIWVVDFSVSKGTYIRALVRDIGRELGARAHVIALERRRAGAVTLESCVSLESLAHLKEQASIDPVKLLGMRLLFCDDLEKQVHAGNPLQEGMTELYQLDDTGVADICSCTPSVFRSDAHPVDGERVSVVIANKLKAIYRYDEKREAFHPDCVFSIPVMRG